MPAASHRGLLERGLAQPGPACDAPRQDQAGAPPNASWSTHRLDLLLERISYFTCAEDSCTCLIEAVGHVAGEAVVLWLLGRCHPEGRQDTREVGGRPGRGCRHEPGAGPVRGGRGPRNEPAPGAAPPSPTAPLRVGGPLGRGPPTVWGRQPSRARRPLARRPRTRGSRDGLASSRRTAIRRAWSGRRAGCHDRPSGPGPCGQ
ncbi:MAG: hypothetical protein QOE58_559 [Actinomycetota bacterium]|nr:hypothetical protein [Actinomycetota bacterium]